MDEIRKYERNHRQILRDLCQGTSQALHGIRFAGNEISDKIGSAS